MTGETVVATVCSDRFESGLMVSLSSLLEHNPWFDHEVRVLSHAEVSPLSPDARRRLSAIYDRVTFVDAELTAQAEIRERVIAAAGSPRRLIASFIYLEAFRFVDTDRVVALDADILVTGDVRDLFVVDEAFAAIEAQHVDNGGRGFLNGGVFVIGRRHLTGSTYDALVALRNDQLNLDTGKTDQIILNSYFDRDEVCWLPTRFNTQKRLLPDRLGDIREAISARDTRIIHFAGDKPWHAKLPRNVRGYEAVDQLWRDAFARCAGPGDMERMLAERERHLRAWINQEDD